MTAWRTQGGAALVVVVCLVAITALMAGEALERGLLGTRIAGLALERGGTVEAAESALRLGGQTPGALARPRLVPDPAMDPAAWHQVLMDQGMRVPLDQPASSAPTPRLLVERMPKGYRLTALAHDPRRRVEAIVQVWLADDAPSRVWRRLR